MTPKRPQPSFADVAAYKILDAVWPVVQAAGIGFTREQWRGRNKVAATALFEADKSPGECASRMALAVKCGGRFYGGIRTLAKLQEHWGPIGQLARDEETPPANQVRNTVLR